MRDAGLQVAQTRLITTLPRRSRALRILPLRSLTSSSGAGWLTWAIWSARALAEHAAAINAAAASRAAERQVDTNAIISSSGPGLDHSREMRLLVRVIARTHHRPDRGVAEP